MQTNRLDTIDGETLMTSPLQPVKFIAGDFLPQGLHILSGSPKSGKSWLALWLCLQVAKGEPVWSFQTIKGTTLYLCLEDSKARIQNRLLDITDDAPPSVHFAITSGSIGCGLEDQIELFFMEHPDTQLVVIDTLQKVRAISNDNAYASDYRDVGILKAIADKLDIAVLLIHHLRKQEDDDPMNMVSGSNGVTGAADSSYVLKKESRGSGRATLYCTGRDIEERKLALEFHRETFLWKLVADSVEQPEILVDKTILFLCEYMRSARHFMGAPAELAAKLREHSGEKIIPNVLSKKLVQSRHELERYGIRHTNRRSNGRRIVELWFNDTDSDDSDGENDMTPCPPNAVPVDPDIVECA